MSIRYKMIYCTLFSVLLLALPALTTIGMNVYAPEYPPLPALEVRSQMVASGTLRIDIWVLGADGLGLDPYWDLESFALDLHFNTNALVALEVSHDPDGSWGAGPPEGFYYGIRTDLIPEWEWIDNVLGVVRAHYAGIADQRVVPTHTPPSGEVRVVSVLFSVLDQSCVSGLDLESNVVSFPHPERGEPPWRGLQTPPPVDHVVRFAPLALFTISTQTPSSYDEVIFDASLSCDRDGSIVDYHWIFGDGSEASGVTVSHSYGLAGFYIVTLRVTDDTGLIGTLSARMAVHVFQYAGVERRLYSVSSDPEADGTNTLYGIFRNYGTASGMVAMKFTVMDRKTNTELGSLENSGTLNVGDKDVALEVEFDPMMFGWDGMTEAKYDLPTQWFFYDEFMGQWIPAPHMFHLVFKVRP